MFSRSLTTVCAIGVGLVILTGCGNDRQSGPDAAAAPDPMPTSALPTPSPAPSATQPTSPPTSGRPATTAPSAPAKQAPRQPKPATKQQLQRIVVRAADVPSGWESVDSLDMLQSDIDARFAACMGVRNTAPHMVAGVQSKTYSDGAVQVASVAASYRSESDLDVDYGMLTHPRMQTCTEQFYRSLFEQIDGTVDSFTTKVTLDPATSPPNVVAVVDNKLVGTLAGTDVTVYERTVYIRGPLLEVQVVISSTNEPIPTAVLKPIVAKVSARAHR